MSPGRNRRTTSEPVDDVYEINLDDESAEDALREAVEAVEAVESPDRPATDDAADADSAAGGDELAVMREKYLHALADFDNYRKRTERERAETARTAQAEPLRGFLGVVDNLDRALNAGGSQGDLKAGVQMILRQTEDLLRRFGVEPVAALGQPFDPALHEAVVRFEDAAVDQPTVSEEFQKGYRYHGRLLRPAMVKVAVPVEDDGATDGEDRQLS
jgi:molecular chaperone GrpE